MRHPFRSILIVAFAFTLSCGSNNESGRLLVAPVRPPTKLVPMSQPVNAMAAGDTAVSVRRQTIAFIVGAIRAAEPEKEQPLSTTSSPTTPGLVVVAPTTSTLSGSVDWHCVAVAETGADFTMHGSTYSTAYGVVNDIVEDYASPEVAARVFAGTASQAEQTDIVVRFAADHGTGGWGELTKQKCGL